METPYKSDRWITPGVVVTLILAVLLGLVAIVAAASWLTAIGKDPKPMFEFVLSGVGGLAGSASLVLQMANRKTATKTERNTGVLASAVYEVADAMPRPRPANRHADPDDTLLLESRAAPAAPRGS